MILVDREQFKRGIVSKEGQNNESSVQDKLDQGAVYLVYREGNKEVAGLYTNNKDVIEEYGKGTKAGANGKRVLKGYRIDTKDEGISLGITLSGVGIIDKDVIKVVKCKRVFDELEQLKYYIDNHIVRINQKNNGVVEEYYLSGKYRLQNRDKNIEVGIRQNRKAAIDYTSALVTGPNAVKEYIGQNVSISPILNELRYEVVLGWNTPYFANLNYKLS